MRNNPNTSAARAISETIGEDWLADLPQAMQVLEKRYVFDAALVADLTDAASHSGDSTVTASTDPSLGDVLNSAAESLATTEADASGASSPSAVYVIDANVDQADTLIAGLPADAVIIRIDSTSDGVAQLAEALEGMNNIGSLHIFAHGEAGSLSLGASVLDQASMETLYRATLAGLGTHLSADADIMIYGCNFAAGAEGQAAADTLAALTGADVSASTDLTGAARLGGDWDLEYDSGSIETQALSFAAYDATLDLASISASGAPTTSGGSNVGATATWSNVATVSGTTVDIRATVVSADAGATIGFGTTGDDLRVELENGTAVITWEIFVAGTTTPFTADVTFQIADLDGPNIETVSAAAAGTVESNTNLSIDTTGGIVTAAGTQNQNSESTSMIAYSWGGVSSMSVTYTAATGTDIRIFNHDGDLDLPFTDPVDVNTIGNNPPDAVNDSATTQMNTALSGTVATNDTDPDGDTLTYTQGTGPTNGTLTFNGNGTYTYTPNTGYTGTDSFTYSISDGRGGTDTATVTITITAPNSPPVAGDDTFNGNFNYVYIDSVANNDSDPNGDTLTFTQTSAAANGTVSLATDGSFSYTPNTGFSGTDTFTYSVSDGNGGSDTATVTITIPANSPPVAGDDTFNGNFNAAYSSTVATNDSDPNGDTLTYALGTGPTNGTVTLNTNGSFTYTPNAGYSGTDTFTYSISDGNGGSDTATVTITIPANSPPDAVNDAFGTLYETSFSDTVATNDSDPNGDTLTYTLGTGPTNGTVTLNTNGTFTYTPNTGYSGQDSFTYSISDGNGGTDTATATITVTGTVNNPPDAVNDAFNATYNAAFSSTVATNDTDPDGDTLTYTLGTGPTDGTVTLNTNGSFTYTPTTGYSGTDSFTYSISDGNGGTDTATVTLTVPGPANSPPDAVNDAFGTLYETAFSDTVATNDSDPNGDTLTYTLGTGPTNGTISLNTNGTFTYTPNTGYSGQDSFTYSISDGNGGTDTATATITVTGTVNNPPDAVNDAFNATYNAAFSSTVATNDTDPDGDTLTYTLGTGPTDGTVTLNTNGSFTYTPTTGYSGTDSFTYSISDGNGGTDTATVTLTVPGPTNNPPNAVNDSFGTAYNTSVSGDVCTNDTDADNDLLSHTLTTGPTNGTVTLNTDGTFTYTPNTGYSGTDTFTYTSNDGNGGTDTATVTITVAGPVNSPPNAVNDSFSTAYNTAVSGDVCTNDTDANGDFLTHTLATGPTNGTVTLNANGTFTYTPNSGYSGTDTFTYTSNDGNGGTDTATVTITVGTRPNSAPDAVNDTVSTNADQPLTGTVATNDSDPDSDTLNFAVQITPTHGTVTLNTNGTFTYTPTAGYSGQDSFTYTVNDGNGGTDSAVVVVSVIAVNDAPVFTTTVAPQANVDGQVISLNIGANVTDVDSPQLIYAANGLPPGLSINPLTGVITGTLDRMASEVGPTENGVYPVTVTVVDLAGGVTTQTFTWTITNPGPDAVNDTVSTDAGVAYTGSVATNDRDPDGDPVTFALGTGPTHGTVTLAGNGAYTYTPTGGYNGPDSFTYTMTDSQGASDTATVSITVVPVNGPPVVTGTIPTQTGTDLSTPTLDISSCFADPQNDPLTFTATGLPPGLSINAATGVISGTVAQNAGVSGPTSNGVYSVVITATDPSGLSVNHTFSWTITNPAPDAVNDSFNGLSGQPVTGTVATNDSDPDGDATTYTIVSGPTAGSVVLNTNGTFTYSGNPLYSGTDSFVYKVTDADGSSDTATSTFTIAPTEIAPPGLSCIISFGDLSHLRSILGV